MIMALTGVQNFIFIDNAVNTADIVASDSLERQALLKQKKFCQSVSWENFANRFVANFGRSLDLKSYP